jgi:hypothetical protein
LLGFLCETPVGEAKNNGTLPVQIEVGICLLSLIAVSAQHFVYLNVLQHAKVAVLRRSHLEWEVAAALKKLQKVMIV